MAKKIVLKTASLVESTCATLRTAKIEHVRVHYPAHKNRKGQDYIVVRNVLLAEVRKICGDNIKRVTNARHYEETALRFIDSYYEPKFTCTCRNCGKTFASRVKTAVWCSKECHKDFRNAKRKA